MPCTTPYYIGIGPAKAIFCTRSLVVLVLLLACCRVGLGQIDDPEVARDLLENFFRENEQANEADAQAFLEMLETRLEHPLDLNRADRDELAGLRLLNEFQIKNLLDYRARLGNLLTIHELQAVPGWEPADIRRLMPFVRVENDLQKTWRDLPLMLFSGQNELLLRGVLPARSLESEKWEGSPRGFALRFKHRFGNQLSLGLSAENDPGEAFFRGSNRRGFDFYGGHFFLQNVGKNLRSLAVGDFSARFGQGLLLQTGFAAGKTAETVAVARAGRRLAPFSAFGENAFFRGGGATLGLPRKLELTVFAARRRRDANLIAPDEVPDFGSPDAFFSAFQLSGLHRTSDEIGDEKAVGEQTLGISLARTSKNGHLAANFLHLKFDKTLRTSTEAYRIFAFSGEKLAAWSLDYAWSHRNWHCFGETAQSDKGKIATLNGLVLAPDRRLTLAAVFRHFDRAYQSVYAAPMAEASGAANETGLYLGLEARPTKHWKLNVYADAWRHPWLRFSANGPSTGQELLGRAIFSPRKNFAAQALFQSETKERNAIGTARRFLQKTRSDRARLHLDYRLGGALEMSSRVEWTFYKIENQAVTRGYLAYQELGWRKIGKPFSGSARYVVFDTQDSGTRVYAFERDLFSALSVPSFAGRGWRFYLNLAWRLRKFCSLEGRFGQTFLEKTVSEASAPGRTSELKLQLRWRF